MFIKIYFNNTPLFLCDKIEPEIEPYIHHDDAVFIDELNSHTVKSMIHELQLEKIHAGVFLHPDLAELKKQFFKKFEIIQAGGGLVRNEAGHYLLIFRRGTWDLPKGKLDDGESMEECAVREVQEETGLTSVKLETPLLITYHTYHQGTKFILKESHWYIMTYSGSETPVPQTSEDITRIEWVAPDKLSPYLANCFPSVADVLKAGLAE